MQAPCSVTTRTHVRFRRRSKMTTRHQRKKRLVARRRRPTGGTRSPNRQTCDSGASSAETKRVLLIKSRYGLTREKSEKTASTAPGAAVWCSLLGYTGARSATRLVGLPRPLCVTLVKACSRPSPGHSSPSLTCRQLPGHCDSADDGLNAQRGLYGRQATERGQCASERRRVSHRAPQPPPTTTPSRGTHILFVFASVST